MTDLKSFRREWSANHKRLRQELADGEHLQAAKELFTSQHAVLHSRDISGSETWSYADEIFLGVSENQLKIIPDKCEHSLVWILWHISRIEDITMNILVADQKQMYHQDSWQERLKSPIHHSGNVVKIDDLHSLNNQIDTTQLFEYRNAVGRQTRKVVNRLQKKDLYKKPSPQGLERIRTEGAVVPEAEVIIEYWSRRKYYQLLLMPPTRHIMVHLNEAYAIKEKLR
jgi:hypothetical protein